PAGARAACASTAVGAAAVRAAAVRASAVRASAVGASAASAVGASARGTAHQENEAGHQNRSPSVLGHGRRASHQPAVTPNNLPMPIVRPIASAPPMVTRSAARPTGAAPSFAPYAPRPARLTSDTPAMTGMRHAAGASSIATMGSAANDAKLTA